MSDTVVTIDGFFRVVKCVKNEYGVQATIAELAQDYPQSFSLELPAGHMWDKGETAHLVLVCNPRTLTAKVGGNRFVVFVVTDYKKRKVTVSMVEEEDVKKQKS